MGVHTCMALLGRVAAHGRSAVPISVPLGSGKSMLGPAMIDYGFERGPWDIVHLGMADRGNGGRQRMRSVNRLSPTRGFK